jgi:hypothetical protein
MKLLPIAMVFCLATPLPLAAQTPTAADSSPFTGTWKADVKSAKLPTKPDQYLLKGGTYSCSSCTPAIKLAADGQFHPVTSDGYYDEMRVAITDPNTVSYATRLKGKDVGTSTDTVSPDGKMLTSAWRSVNAANGTPVEGSATWTRLSASPAGAHAISGSWRRAAVQSVSDAALSLTLDDTGKGLKLSTGTGESYDAVYGGPAVPMIGDPASTMVRVARIDPRTIVETGMRDGKVTYTYRMQVAPDGRSMTVLSSNKRSGNQTTFIAYKQ